MKILFLNLWGGKLREPLRDFLESQRDIDVFCFQEASQEGKVISEGLLDHFQLFTEAEPLSNNHGTYSLATYVQKSLEVFESRAVSEKDHHTGLGLLTRVKTKDRSVSILNIHGNPHAIEPQDTKRDTPSRIQQSEDFLASLSKTVEPDIMGGDFNLFPDTKSLELIREAGFRDLIQEFSISTTRNRYAWEKYPTKYLFSDYVFVSSSLTVQSFEVPTVEVSDHLPMIVEILP